MDSQQPSDSHPTGSGDPPPEKRIAKDVFTANALQSEATAALSALLGAPAGWRPSPSLLRGPGERAAAAYKAGTRQAPS